MRALAQRGEKLEPELRERWQKQGRKTSGTWAQVFGDDEWGQEVFTAWHYARFVEGLVKAGKQRYDLPMYVNAALNRTGRKPGEYPSGGPLPHLLDVWKAGAPSLDFLAPDIYFPNFAQLAARYERADNLLFIPEANNATNPQGSANAFFSFGELDSIGFSPFSIESLGDAPNALSQAYEVFGQLQPLILESRGRARMAGFRAQILEDGSVVDTPAKTTIAGFEFTVTFIDPWTPRDQQTIANHGGMLIHAGGEDFWFAGQGITVTFKGAGDGPPLVGIDIAEEGVFDRRANGYRAAGSTAIRPTRAGTSACRRASRRSRKCGCIVIARGISCTEHQSRCRRFPARPGCMPTIRRSRVTAGIRGTRSERARRSSRVAVALLSMRRPCGDRDLRRCRRGGPVLARRSAHAAESRVSLGRALRRQPGQ